jgi:hypothetical protein
VLSVLARRGVLEREDAKAMGTWDHRGGFQFRLIERLTALIPPPRRQRHRYFWMLTPNAPLRAAVTAPAGC